MYREAWKNAAQKLHQLNQGLFRPLLKDALLVLQKLIQHVKLREREMAKAGHRPCCLTDSPYAGSTEV